MVPDVFQNALGFFDGLVDDQDDVHVAGVGF